MKKLVMMFLSLKIIILFFDLLKQTTGFTWYSNLIASLCHKIDIIILTLLALVE